VFQGIIFTGIGTLTYLPIQGVPIMKRKVTAIIFASFVTLTPSITFADTSVSESGLMKAIHNRIEQINTKDIEKYNRVLELAGDKHDELTAKKDALTNFYKAWLDLRPSIGAEGFNDNVKQDIELAGESYSQASKEFMGLQGEILAKNGISLSSVVLAESINRLSASIAVAN
jgi:hypothetical protein